MNVAIAGGEEFLLGFRLAGIRQTYDTGDDPEGVLRKALEEDGIGVLVVDEDTMASLSEHFRGDLDDSVNPVVVTLSTEAESAQLRDKIVRAIGVDLWER